MDPQDDGEPRLWYLRRLNLFAGLSPATIDSLAVVLSIRTVRRGERIVGPDSAPDRVFIVRSGAVRVYRASHEGRAVTLAILRPGQMFGIAALAGLGQPGTYAVALTESAICETTAAELLRVLAQRPTLALHMLRAAAVQFARLEQQFERLSVAEVPVRLAQVLVQLAEDEGGQLPARLTHDELASFIGSTRATVTKALAQLAARGLVAPGYRRVTIHDLDGLREVAGLTR